MKSHIFQVETGFGWLTVPRQLHIQLVYSPWDTGLELGGRRVRRWRFIDANGKTIAVGGGVL